MQNFSKKIWSVSKMFIPLQTQMNERSGSSVWLEYMPVTHGVASSSLVQTAEKGRKLSPFFYFVSLRMVKNSR